MRRRLVFILLASLVLLSLGGYFLWQRVLPMQNNTARADINACIYITKDEARQILGLNGILEPVNTSDRRSQYINAATCEYNIGRPKTLIIIVSRPSDSEHLKRFREITTTPSPYEVASSIAGREGLLTKPKYDERYDVTNLAGFRYTRANTEIQINANTIQQVTAALGYILQAGVQ